MESMENIIVSVDFGDMHSDVGELVSSQGKIYFRYYPGFIQSGIELSPFKLPLSMELYSAPGDPFDGLFGLFNDSLPDGWGRLLLDRTLISKGISLDSVTPMERLAFVGVNGMGALKYRPAIETGKQVVETDLDRLASEMKKVMEGLDTDLLDALYNMGGSSGGARPKVFVAYHAGTGHVSQEIDPLPEGFEHWIIKFPSSSDPVDIANIEFAYFKMALASGIEMVECRLFNSRSGRVYFGTKRFDRNKNSRIHMHSASGLMHDNYRHSTMDYGHLMDCAFRLEKHVKAYEKIFRLACFNVFAHNRDDHSKNFSFLMNKKREWRFAPAYDLTFSYSSHGHHSTMVAGESLSPGRKQLLELAENFGVARPDEIMEQVRETIANWRAYAKEAGVSSASRDRIDKVLN